MSQPTLAEYYDLVPYMNQAYAQSHPDRLATVATLFGLKAPRVDRCRVLELGCAQGGNILPMGVELPDSEFLGIELSARQVEEGRQTLEATGITNVELREASILDIDASYGQFDYIISHGVYSWVPEAVRQKLLDVYRDHLKPEGVGYISFNTLPGWHMRGMIRDMMRYHVSRFTDKAPEVQVSRARGLLDFLAQSVQGDKNPYGILLRQELDVLGKKADAYFFHEQLEPHNDAFYFHQFCEQLDVHGLRYLGESQVNSMGTFGFPPNVRETLTKLVANQIEMEQYLDFLLNRTFRQTLVCKKERQPSYALNPERIMDFQVASMLRPQNQSPNMAEGASEVFLGSDDARVETKDAILKSAFLCLLERWPQTYGIDELRQEARNRIQPGGASDASLRQKDTIALGNMLLQCYMSGSTRLIEFWQCRPRHVIQVSERPVASPLARYQAARQDTVTTLRHEIQKLSDFGRIVLPVLDGKRDRNAILDVLAENVLSGAMNVEVNGQPVRERSVARDVLGRPLEQELLRFARSALLIS